MTNACKKVIRIIEKRTEDAEKMLKYATVREEKAFLNGVIRELQSMKFVLEITMDGNL